MIQQAPLTTPMPWNLVAPAYSEEVVPMFEDYVRDALRLAAPPRGSRIIDVACGPGTLALLAARDGFAVDALDFSPAMLERLTTRARADGITNVAAQLGDGQALPYDAGVFAAGFSMFGLMFFPDRAAGFAELRRVLAPGARAVVGSWTRIEDTPAMAAMLGALRGAMKQLMGDSAQPGSQDMPLSTEALCRAEMSAAFADVVVHRVPHIQRYPSVDAFWGSLQRTMAPVALLKKNLGDEKWQPISDNVRAAIAGVVGTGEGEVTMTALLSVGTAA